MAKLGTFICRNCGVQHSIALRYEKSDWCVDCVDKTCARQAKERHAPQYPQVVEYRPEDE